MSRFRWLPWIKQKGYLFGHELCFAVPRRGLMFERNVQAFCPTVSNCCGEEALAFYDSAYDSRTGTVLAESLNDAAWAALELECDTSGISDALSLARRRFVHCEETSELGQFLDIWVHRNGHCGDLREPASLRRAAEVYIAQDALAKRAAAEQGHSEDVHQDLFDDEESECEEVQGVNWRQREMCGRHWQVYEEYCGRRYFGESWLLPLGEKHFMRVRLYGMSVALPSREALQELRTFIEERMRRFHVQSPDTEIERPGSIAVEPCTTAPDVLDKRLALEEETARMPYLLDLARPRVRPPRFVSRWWVLLGVVCFIRGSYAAVEYLGWEQVLTIVAVLSIACAIHKKLKEFERKPDSENSGV
ncbi:hypothetical protein [Microbulbifer aggregans]|uniref:hypothetical protein n=1 Tax=Microbulbifer aggregans TaxID=1769779 RepID=UPI001CFF2C6B|nr:hypothetical protein [Microbulbifer aggregans]